METKKLEIKNFNQRTYQLQTYTVKSDRAPLNKPRPLAIVVPGGSFTHLSVKEGEPVALAYVSRGFNACVVSYNLLQDEGKIYPDAGLDVLSTVDYYRRHAAEYQIDPDKIMTIGFSAGGHIVSAANYLAAEPKYQEKYGYEDSQVLPNATILGYPLTDVYKVAFEIGGKADDALPEDPKLVDTALGVSAKTPPTFIFQSWNDPICLPTNAMAYEEALFKNGVKCEAHMFDIGYHGYSLATPDLSTEDIFWQGNPHTARWFEMSLEWLEHLFSGIDYDQNKGKLTQLYQ